MATEASALSPKLSASPSLAGSVVMSQIRIVPSDGIMATCRLRPPTATAVIGLATGPAASVRARGRPACNSSTLDAINVAGNQPAAVGRVVHRRYVVVTHHVLRLRRARVVDLHIPSRPLTPDG